VADRLIDEVGRAEPDFVGATTGGLFTLSAKGFLSRSHDPNPWLQLKEVLLAQLLERGTFVLASEWCDEADWSDISDWHVRSRALDLKLDGVGSRKAEALQFFLEGGAVLTDSQALLRHSSDDAEHVRAAVDQVAWNDVAAICGAFADVVHFCCDEEELVWRSQVAFTEAALRNRLAKWCDEQGHTWEWSDSPSEFDECWVFKKAAATASAGRTRGWIRRIFCGD
jgi:hypothetical protein